MFMFWMFMFRSGHLVPDEWTLMLILNSGHLLSHSLSYIEGRDGSIDKRTSLQYMAQLPSSTSGAIAVEWCITVTELFVVWISYPCLLACRPIKDDIDCSSYPVDAMCRTSSTQVGVPTYVHRTYAEANTRDFELVQQVMCIWFIETRR